MYQPNLFAFPEDGHRIPAPHFPPGSPALWLVDAERQSGQAQLLAPGILDAGELDRAARLVVPADRRCYVAAHVALRLLLGARLGVTPDAVRLTREPCPSCGGPHGRPATDGGVHFSLSHTRGVALLAFADTPVGADVELVPKPETVSEIAGQLHPAESRELAELPEEQRPAAFARVWTRKEAYLKGEGIGLADGLAAEHVGTGPRPRPGPAGWTVTDVGVPAGYAAAVAVRAAGQPPAREGERRK
ncbi:4'-phosphopantetheinyl transferase family protein [Streptomyces sp. NBC_00236]|uniref:4'-phosphopantetheinyl transferase family protein n=1 Tax=Streptomyces sp. NBC_00236 TaxID=2903639 RepID=UPI002E29B1F2|nr:4'-phosphopantetheinyl transferase superfamily protein [Streptomyces sp. NBC_00236]